MRHMIYIIYCHTVYDTVHEYTVYSIQYMILNPKPYTLNPILYIPYTPVYDIQCIC